PHEHAGKWQFDAGPTANSPYRLMKERPSLSNGTRVIGLELRSKPGPFSLLSYLTTRHPQMDDNVVDKDLLVVDPSPTKTLSFFLSPSETRLLRRRGITGAHEWVKQQLGQPWHQAGADRIWPAARTARRKRAIKQVLLGLLLVTGLFWGWQLMQMRGESFIVS